MRGLEKYEKWGKNVFTKIKDMMTHLRSGNDMYMTFYKLLHTTRELALNAPLGRPQAVPKGLGRLHCAGGPQRVINKVANFAQFWGGARFVI